MKPLGFVGPTPTLFEQLISAIKGHKEDEAIQLVNKMPLSDLEQTNGDGDTALIAAAYYKLDKLCELLISKMSTLALNKVSHDGNTALTMCIKHMKKGSVIRICELLLPKMTLQSINVVTKSSKNTAITFAQQKESYEEVIRMIQFYQLIKLIEARHINQAKELITQMDQEALSKTDSTGQTALHLAANNGNEEITKALVHKMSSETINAKTSNNWTALHLAVWQGFEKVAHVLINIMSDDSINTLTREGQTALHFAITKNGLGTVAETLVDRMSREAIGVVSQSTSRTALHSAVEKGLENLARKLITVMSDEAINATTQDGKTALHIVAEKRIHNEELRRALLHKTKLVFIKDIISKDSQFKQWLENTLLTYYQQQIDQDPERANNYFTKGNVHYYLEQKANAIKCYEKTLQLDASYKERIWNNIDVNEKQLAEALQSSLPRFLINTIAFVPDKDDTMAGDSSDEEYDDTFKYYQNRYDSEQGIGFYYPFSQNKSFLPYRTCTITQGTQGKGKNKQPVMVESQEVGSFRGEEKQLSPENTNTLPSRVVGPLLNKLVEHGYGERDKDKLAETVSISIGLNRPKSLSTRKNKALLDELQASNDPVLAVDCVKTGFYWEHNWYNQNNQSVPYAEVRKFYKQLKRYDKQYGTQKAKEFREINEQGTAVPYQALREYVKSHQKTQALVQKFRQKSPNSDIYFSFIDSDTVDFNGIYSAYLRIHQAHKMQYGSGPTVMSTGYEFRGNGEDYPYQAGSQLDRAIRVETAKYIPLGVYYPEPNFCVFLPPTHIGWYTYTRTWDSYNLTTLTESFISQGDSELKKQGNAESVALLRQVQKRQGATFIFSDDNPLITEIPARTKLTEHGNPRVFSQQFKNKRLPTPSDIKAIKFNQSHFDDQNWVNNLFINIPSGQGINKSWVNAKAPVKNLLTLNPSLDNITNLFNNVNSDMFLSIVTAVQGVRAIIEKFVTSGIISFNVTANKKTVINVRDEDVLPVAIKTGSQLVTELITEKSSKNLGWQQKLDDAIITALGIDSAVYSLIKTLHRSSLETNSGVSNQADSKTIPSDYNQTNDNALDIKPKYMHIENKGGGDCAVLAIIDALQNIGNEQVENLSSKNDEHVMLVRKGICEATKYFFSLYKLALDLSQKEHESQEQFQARLNNNDIWLEVRDHYKNIFGQDNFNTFKKVISLYLTNPLSDKDTNAETRHNLSNLKETLNQTNSWEDIQTETIKEIFIKYKTLDVNIKAIVDDHKLDSNISSEDYYNYVVQPGIWLSNSEMSAYLLTLGFVVQSREVYQSGTYITYANTDKQILCFYNNGKDSNADRGAGTHWVAAIIQQQLKGTEEEKPEQNIGWVDSYFSKYTLDGLSNILKLRLQGLNLQHIKVLEGTFITEDNNNILELLFKVFYSKEETILVPINLFNKHAVGIIIKKVGNSAIQVKYIDPENKPIPVQLEQILKSDNLSIQQLDIEQQKYHNCGLVVIENLIAEVTGEEAKLGQETAPEVYSILYEQHLIEKALEEEKARKNTAEVKVKQTQSSQTASGNIESPKVIVSPTKALVESQEEYIKGTSEIMVTPTIVTHENSNKPTETVVVVSVTDTAQKDAPERTMEEVWQESQKQTAAGSGRVINMNSPVEPTSKLQTLKSMEEAWGAAENKVVAGLNTSGPKEVRLGSQELDTMNTAWKETQPQSTKVNIPESIPKLPQAIPQRPVEPKGQQTDIDQKQLPTQFSLNHTAQKAVVDIAKKIVASAAETLRMAMYVDPYELKETLHHLAAAGSCTVTERPRQDTPEGRARVIGLNHVKIGHTTSLSSVPGDIKDLQEDEFVKNFFAGNKTSGYENFQNLQEVRTSLLEGINLTRGDYSSWAQQYQEEIPLSGDHTK